MRKLLCLVTVLILCLASVMPCAALRNPDERFRETLGVLDNTYNGYVAGYMAEFMTDLFTPSYVTGEEGPLYIAAAAFETVLSLYAEVDLTLLQGLRSKMSYDETREAYRIDPFDSVNESLPKREYRGYVSLGDNRYEVYYEEVEYEFLADILNPNDPFWDTVADVGYGETVVYNGKTYEYSLEDGFYRIVGSLGRGHRYTVEYLTDTDTVRILSSRTFAQGEMPERFGEQTADTTDTRGDNAGSTLTLDKQTLILVAISAGVGFVLSLLVGLLFRRRQ